MTGTWDMKRSLFFLATLALVALTASTQAMVHYVDANSSAPAAPYTNWFTAAQIIQDAVDAAAAGDEVLVTNGIYATGQRLVGTNLLASRVAVTNSITLRSVSGPEFTIIRGAWDPVATNGPAAIRCVSLANGASLLGFTLTGGATRTNWGPDAAGGGVWCASHAATVSNCVLTANSGRVGAGACQGTLKHCLISTNEGNGADYCVLLDCSLLGNKRGFGAYISTLTNCTVEGNAGGVFGYAAAMVLGPHAARPKPKLGGDPFEELQTVISHCNLIGNSRLGYGDGGGAYSYRLIDCVLRCNSAYVGGGASWCDLDNCTVESNTASAEGGGLNSCYAFNCRISGNSAPLGGGAAGSPGREDIPCSSFLAGCTLTGNSADVGGGAYYCDMNGCIAYFNTATNGPNFYQRQYGGTVWYSCTFPQPVYGYCNITNNPRFIDYEAGNLRLQSNSPCINAGGGSGQEPDLDGNSRNVGGTMDMGAYEYKGTGSVISYAWLMQYGFPTDGSADYTDPDGDGMNNWQEWHCLTDPTDALSFLRLLAPSVTSTNITLRWQGAEGVRYSLECCTNPAPPLIFSPEAGLWGQDGWSQDGWGRDGMMTLTVPRPPDGPALYRLKVGD